MLLSRIQTASVGILILGIFSLVPLRTQAIVLDKSAYTVGEAIIAPDGTGPVVLYNTGTNETYFEVWGFDPGSNINYFGISPGNYSLIELTTSGICQGQGLSYADCKLTPEFIGEFLFSITAPPPSGGGAESDEEPPIPALLGGGIAQYAPEIVITFPKLGDILSRAGTISYKATDRNDNGAPTEREKYGMAKNPVTLFYSDKIAEWSRSSSVAPSDKTLIAENQPAEASYAWSIAGLAPGIFYRIVADVADAAGAFAQAVSDIFMVDFEAPAFVVSANPPATQGKDVVISVDVLENLKEPPAVTVTQSGGTAVSVAMKGQGSHYEGTYVVRKGYDGIATIAVSGTDAAGNVGTTTLSGGTFAVGVNPPPAPRISYPQNNLVVGTSTISVLGTVRADTTAFVTLNGADIYTASSSPDGAFAVSGVRLSKDTNRGVNILSVAARDRAGLASEAVPLSIKYNIAPTVAISSPAEKASVSATASLVARAADENGDPLSFTYQILPARSFDAAAATSTGGEWQTIADAVPSASFSWDSSEADDGQYFLRVVADDGFEKAFAAPVPFSVRNTLPFFRFEDGRKTVTNRSSVTIAARALAPESVSPRPAIVKVEYSLDNGKKWKPVSLASGGGASEARFSMTFDGLAEGTKGILWRVKDSRGFYGKASHPVIVDLTAPAAPILNYPADGAFITNADDEDASRSGLQIRVAGTAEPQSAVTLRSGDATITTKTMPDGRFTFRSMDIPRRGANRLEATATDGAGNASAAAVVRVAYDNPPAVSILSPKPFRGLAGKAVVSWSVADADGDPIQDVVLEYRRGERAFAALPIDPARDSFVFDVSRFLEAADYQLRLSASDGMATGTDSIRFSVDKTPPVLSSFTLDASVLGKGGALRGRGAARDALSGIEYVEYAVAEGGEKPESFSTALLTGGFLQENATFAVKHPSPLADGGYTVYARAVDAAGNVSSALSRTLIVDMSPPRIGSFDIVAQGARAAPDEQGTIVAYTDTDALFEVSLEGDTGTASLLVGSTSVPLAKSIVSGLWQAAIDTGVAGTTTLAISASDDTRNAFAGKSIGALVVTARPVAPPTPRSGVGGFFSRIINYLLSL